MLDLKINRINEIINKFLIENKIPTTESVEWTPIPFSGKWGMSTSFFKNAALEKTTEKAIDVPKRAREIAAKVGNHLDIPEGFDRIEAINGYLNLYYSISDFSLGVINAVLEKREKYGYGSPKDKTIMVEFSQPNTHKAFHVGHLRNVIFGSAISNILEAAGYEIIRANYIGDIGLHVIKWLWNYKKYHDDEYPPKTDKTRWMGELYAEAERRLYENPELESEVRQIFNLWDKKDPETTRLWAKTREWSLDGLNEIYETLDVRFDRVYYESEVEKPGKEIVQELINRGIATDERPTGSVVVHIDDLLGLDEEKYRSLVVLRSDNTSLYSTKDLALAGMKFDEYNLFRSIYVVDVRQSHYFQQIFKILEISGYDWAKNCYHLAYEIVNLPGNITMSSRDGTVVLLEDLIREATQRTFQISEERNPSLSEMEREKAAKIVALGAIKFPMLDRDNMKIATFDWNSAFNFTGHTAPYVQYMYVRASSILRKSEESYEDLHQITHDLAPAEAELVDLISHVPDIIQRAAEEYKTLPVTNHLYELARAFSEFYDCCPVLNSDPQVRIFRLKLVEATQQVLSNLLCLLGIQTLDVM